MNHLFSTTDLTTAMDEALKRANRWGEKYLVYRVKTTTNLYAVRASRHWKPEDGEIMYQILGFKDNGAAYGTFDTKLDSTDVALQSTTYVQALHKQRAKLSAENEALRAERDKWRAGYEEVYQKTLDLEREKITAEETMSREYSDLHDKYIEAVAERDTTAQATKYWRLEYEAKQRDYAHLMTECDALRAKKDDCDVAKKSADYWYTAYNQIRAEREELQRKIAATKETLK